MNHYIVIVILFIVFLDLLSAFGQSVMKASPKMYVDWFRAGFKRK